MHATRQLSMRPSEIFTFTADKTRRASPQIRSSNLGNMFEHVYEGAGAKIDAALAAQ